LSGWTIGELKNRGYKAYGMAGLKHLRRENPRVKLGDGKEMLLSTIRFKPRILWLFISEITQLITYHFPILAFEVFCVKNIK